MSEVRLRKDDRPRDARLQLKSKPLFETQLGRLFCGPTEDVVSGELLDSLRGTIDLIFTSPPFPLNAKKKYGNHQGEEYLNWLGKFGKLFSELLSPTGSLVMEIGNAWEPKRPVQSLLPTRALLKILDEGKFVLCQEITYFNPARLPSPAEWVTIRRERLKDSTTKVWWMAKNDHPKANNKHVLQPYSMAMQKLLKSGKYNAGSRPSEHHIGEKSFLQDNGGSIAPNMLQFSNTHSNLDYQSFCKEEGVKPHPARMPEGLVEFFVKFLTDENDLVLEPFAGSNTTGFVAERLKRNWLSVEADPTYARASVSRFSTAAAKKLLEAQARRRLLEVD